MFKTLLKTYEEAVFKTRSAGTHMVLKHIVALAFAKAEQQREWGTGLSADLPTQQNPVLNLKAFEDMST